MSKRVQATPKNVKLSAPNAPSAPPIDLSGLSTAELLFELDVQLNNEKWSKDPLGFARDVFPHHFNRSAAEFHGELVDLVFPEPEDTGGKKLCVAAPRGFAKSTIVSLLLPIC